MPEGREALVSILKRLDGRFVPGQLARPDDRLRGHAHHRLRRPGGRLPGRSAGSTPTATWAKERDGNRTYADTRSAGATAGMVDPYVRNRAQDIYRQTVERRRITLETMTRALNALAGVKGRKAMVLVSQGFIYEQGFKEMKALVEASTRVNVPIHFIDTRGLKALPEFMTTAYAQPFDVQDTVAVLADISREAEGARERGARHRRDRGKEHERPRERDPARVRRVPGLLPPRLQPRRTRPATASSGGSRSGWPREEARASRSGPAAATMPRRRGRRCPSRP